LNVALSQKPANLDALKDCIIDGRPISGLITDKVGVTGEKMELSYYDFVSAEKAIAYNHQGNKLATVVGFNKSLGDHDAKEIAMQVAAMSPVAVDKADVPAEVVAKEKEIAKEQILLDPKNASKPAEMIEKIAEGKLQKFFIESTLLNQEFVKEGKISVREHLSKLDKGLTVTGFKRFTLNA
jgi:elongation factor Ts